MSLNLHNLINFMRIKEQMSMHIFIYFFSSVKVDDDDNGKIIATPSLTK